MWTPRHDPVSCRHRVATAGEIRGHVRNRRMREFAMPQGFPVHIQREETQGNNNTLAGGLGVPSSNLGAPTIRPLVPPYFPKCQGIRALVPQTPEFLSAYFVSRE